jgi:flavin-dependent dehydrogenase
MSALSTVFKDGINSRVNNRVYDVVIVGAGPAGSALAISLATAGWHVLLVERERLPRHKVCGEFLSPEAQGTLSALGIDPLIRALAPVNLSGAQVTTASGRTIDLEMQGQAWGISRYALDAALAAAAEESGAEVQCETTVTHCTELKTTHLVRLRRRQKAANAHKEIQKKAQQKVLENATEETEKETEQEGGGSTSVECRAVVLACGRHGMPAIDAQSVPLQSAQAANTTPPNRTAARNSYVGIKCHFADVAMPKQVELYLFAGGYIGINNVEDGNANVCALASYDAFARGGRSPRALIEAAAQWNPAFGERLHQAYALPETECSVAPVNSWRAVSPWDQVPHIGDTAAMIPPLCGDGMAMALRSAELCAALLDGYLRNHYSWHQMGREYSRQWHKEFDQRLRVGRWLEAMLLSAPTADLLLRVGAILPSVANYLVRATRGANS